MEIFIFKIACATVGVILAGAGIREYVRGNYDKAAALAAFAVVALV